MSSNGCSVKNLDTLTWPVFSMRFKGVMGPEVLVYRKRLVSNIKHLQHEAHSQCLFPVLKADAYGHRAALCAQVLEENFSDQELPYFCVARTSEARELRDAGVQRAILVLSHTDWGLLDENLFPSNTTVVLNNESDVQELLSRVARCNDLPRVHFYINSGMNRLGFSFREIDILATAVERVLKAGVVVEGFCTHFAEAESENQQFTLLQIKRFDECLEVLKSRVTESQWNGVKWLHASNSAGLAAQFSMSLNSMSLKNNWNAWRPGLSMWGVAQDSEQRDRQTFKKHFQNLEAVLELRAPITQVIKIPSGDTVGYGRYFRAERETYVGVVPLGYADGVDRSLGNSHSNSGQLVSVGMMVRSFRVPLIGRVSMDLCCVDLTDHPERESLYRSQTMEWAYFIGQGQCVESVAAQLQTISYEVLCSLAHRLERKLV